MRSLFLATLIALPTVPALAQDQAGPSYDDTILLACLDRTAASMEQGNVEAHAQDQCVGKASTLCMEGPGGYSTVGMVECLQSETRQWDGLLNTWYQSELDRATTADAQLDELGSAAPKAAPVLKEAQRNWIAFRDKSCEYQSVYFQGGTAGGPAASGCMLELTAQQALRLRTVPGSGQ